MAAFSAFSIFRISPLNSLIVRSGFIGILFFLGFWTGTGNGGLILDQDVRVNLGCGNLGMSEFGLGEPGGAATPEDVAGMGMPSGLIRGDFPETGTIQGLADDSSFRRVLSPLPISKEIVFME